MSETFVLTSSAGGARLEFRGTIRPFDEGTYMFAAYVAALVTVPLSATVMVNDGNVDRWSGFFADLAAGWRGWDGVKSCGSIDGNVRIACTSDRLGHIAMLVRLRDANDLSDWTAETTLQFESGQLDALARAAVKYFG